MDTATISRRALVGGAVVAMPIAGTLLAPGQVLAVPGPGFYCTARYGGSYVGEVWVSSNLEGFNISESSSSTAVWDIAISYGSGGYYEGLYGQFFGWDLGSVADCQIYVTDLGLSNFGYC